MMNIHAAEHARLSDDLVLLNAPNKESPMDHSTIQ